MQLNEALNRFFIVENNGGERVTFYNPFELGTEDEDNGLVVLEWGRDYAEARVLASQEITVDTSDDGFSVTDVHGAKHHFRAYTIVKLNEIKSNG